MSRGTCVAQFSVAASPRHHRLGRRRQEHVDRPATGTSPERSSSISSRPCDRPQCAGSDSRAGPFAAHRRVACGARTGDHDRRRLSLLPDPASRVHHRRRAGHERYTRDMVTGTATADLAVILIDARTGPGSRRAAMCSSRHCSASSASSCVSTRWTSSDVAGRRRSGSNAKSRSSARASESPTSRSSRYRPRMGQRRRASGACHGTRARAALSPRARPYRVGPNLIDYRFPVQSVTPGRQNRECWLSRVHRPDRGRDPPTQRSRRRAPVSAITRGSPRSTRSPARSTRRSPRCP